MKKIKKKLILIVIFLIVLILFSYYFFVKKSDNSTIKVVDKINNYSYTLNENDSTLKKELYYQLKNELNKDEVDYEHYAKLISELFVVDVFSLDTKYSKYDIGGLEYIIPSRKEDFKVLMGNTLYDSIENNYNGKRKQTLPIVKSIDVEYITESTFRFDNNDLLAYDISLEWDYDKEIGYDKTAKIIVARIDDVMYVVEYSTN